MSAALPSSGQATSLESHRSYSPLTSILHAVSYAHSNLSGIFTFAFSWYLGLEGFTYGKVLGVLACFLGAVCVGVSDSEQSGPAVSGEHTVAGDTVALAGAVFYGLYTTTLKYLVRLLW